MAIISRFAAAVVVSSIFSSVLTAIPAVAAAETGLAGLYPHIQQPRANRHETIAKSRRAKLGKRGQKSKTGVCKKNASSSIASSSTAAPTTTSSSSSEKSSEKSTPTSKKPDPTPEPKPDYKPSNPGGCKKGLAWNDAGRANIRMFSGAPRPACWYYTWSVWPVPNDDGLEHVPMLWGIDKKAEFDKNFPKGASYMLGFNEPDHHTQADTDPTWAGNWWRDNVAHKYGVAKITPGTTGGDSGIEWQKKFLAACDGCDWAGMAIHFYGTSAKEFIAYATKVHNTFGMNIWVTELACQNFGNGAQCDDGQNSAFVRETSEWMEATGWIDRYAYFGTLRDMYNVNPKCRLMDASGQNITPLGWQLFG